MYSNKPRFTKGFCSKFFDVKEKTGHNKFLNKKEEEYFPIEVIINFNDKEDVI